MFRDRNGRRESVLGSSPIEVGGGLPNTLCVPLRALRTTPWSVATAPGLNVPMTSRSSRDGFRSDRRTRQALKSLRSIRKEH